MNRSTDRQPGIRRLLLLISALLVSSSLQLSPTPSVAVSDPDPSVLMTQGQEAYQRGAFEDALAKWKEAAQRYESHGDRHGHSQALVSGAQAAQAIGHTTQALQMLELAWGLAQQDSDMMWRATVLAHLGRSYLVAQQLEAAAAYLTQAQEAARDQRVPALSASIRHDQGVLAALRKQDQDALAAFTETIEMAQDAGLPLIALRARINAARTALRLNQPEASRQWLDEALNQLTAMAPSHEKAVGLMNVGLLYHRLAPVLSEIRDPLLLRAAGTLQESATVAESIKDGRTLSYAVGHLGHLYESESRLDEALQLTRRAIFTAQSVDAPESLYRWQWQLGRLLVASGQLDEAIASYRQAITTLQPIRQEVAMASSESSLSDPQPVRPLFFELSDLLLQRASLTEDPPLVEGYVLAARDTIEAYKAAELRDYFRDECVDALQARVTKFDSLSPTTAIVYPILFPTRVELVVSLPTGLTRRAIPVSADVVTKEIRAFRRTVEKRTTREYLPHAQQLYDWLVRPIDEDLQRLKITTLIFVPDSALRTIPMAALHDGSGFLIQKYAVALTPGITLTDPHPLNREKIRFLASGLTKAVQGYPALPYVAEEMNSIHSLYSGDQLLNQDFQIPKLEQELRAGRYGILHIATHGKFSTDVNDSFLLTFDGKLTMNKLDQLIGLFRFRDDPLELLTLSACQTGIGDDRAALGLAGVAIKAGARSALATLWFINDEASAALVSEFYRQLRDPSVSKAVAIQRAQIKLLGDRVYDHPAYWSPFLLLNNWL
ncbi:MAG TPA: CHAT domain-containing protein [Nitrospira sp.]|nr:CHAT domain-containing protein [Nitrospira sp.]